MKIKLLFIKIAFLVLSFFSTNHQLNGNSFYPPIFFSPQDSLPSKAALFAALDTFFDLQLQSQLAEFQIKERHKWLKYLPAIGITYTVAGQPRPSVSYSTNTIYRSIQDKQVREAKIRSIEKNNQIQREQTRQELQQLLKSYHLLEQDLQFLKQLNEIDQQLFEIATVQFSNAELAPSVYLPKKRAFLQKGYEIFKREQELEGRRMEILRAARY